MQAQADIPQLHVAEMSAVQLQEVQTELMSYVIIDSTGAANDIATSQGIVDLEAIAGPKLTSFLDTGEADEDLAKEIVTEVKDDDATAYIADLFGGTAPFVLSNGIEEDDEETDGAKYSDDQPRDESGRWTDGGGTGGASDASSAAQDLYTAATGSETGITQHIKDAVTSNGGEVHGLEHRVKTADSLARKIESDAKVKGISPKDAAAQINDSLRYTGVFTSDKFGSGAEQTLNDLRAKGYTVSQVKNFWGGDTYKGTNVHITSPDGQKLELQFHTPASFALKTGKSHDLYEKLRTSTSKASRTKYGAQLTSLWSAIASPLHWAMVKAGL